MTASAPTGPESTAPAAVTDEPTDVHVAHQDADDAQDTAVIEAVSDSGPEAVQPRSPEDVLDLQVAAELAQELSLVARAMFAQLLPSTAANAVAGIHRGFHAPAMTTQPEAPASPTAPAAVPVTPTPVSVPSAPPVVPVPTVAPATSAAPVAAVPVPSVPVPAHPQVVTEAPEVQPQAAAPAPSVAVPVPSVPVPTPEVKTVPARSGRRTMAMLDEIGFLDD